MALTLHSALILIAVILFAVSSLNGVQLRVDLFKLAWAFVALSLII